MKLNFHWQIILLIASGIFLLAVVGSLTAGYIINQKVSELVFDQAEQVTASFARQSILPLLSGVGANANVDIESTLAYSNVKALGIYKINGELLTGTEGADYWGFTKHLPVKGTPFEPRLIKETPELWVFIAPVYDTDIFDDRDSSIDSLFTQTPALLGFVRVTIDRSNLSRIQQELLTDNFFISVAIASVLLLVAILATRSLVKPLYRFISLMKKAEEGDDSVRANLAGPVEVVNMSRAFNTMMQALEQRRVYAEKQHYNLLVEIDERVRVESALRESESNLKKVLAQNEAVVATIPGIIIEISREGKLLWWNKRVSELVGLSDKDIAKKSVLDFVPDELKSETLKSFSQCFINGTCELHTDIITSDGNVPYQFNGVKIDSESQALDKATILAVGMDDSESVMAQKALKQARDAALESAKVKSEFLANMSHEIRTPMNGMMGMLQLLDNSNLNAEQKNFSDIALRSADHLVKIINDVLDVSKIEAGKLELHRGEFSPRNLIENVVELFATRAYEKGLTIYADVDFKVPPSIVSDSHRLEQVLSNLISNAIKFTDQGYILVKASVLDEGSPFSCLALSVIDTGIGIETDLQEEVFESFAQVDGSSTRKYSGTGLGLAIVKQLTSLLGGTVSLKSEYGKGSQFTISIPLHQLQPSLTSGEVVKLMPDTYKIFYLEGDLIQSSIFNTFSQHLKQPYRRLAPNEYAEFSVAEGDRCIFFVDVESFSGLVVSEMWPKISRFRVYVLVNHLNSYRVDEISEKFESVIKLLIPIRFEEFYKALVETGDVNYQSRQESLPENVGIFEQKRILVVEDNEVNQRVIMTMLNKMGHDAFLATDGKQAVDIVKENESIEFVFMDCQMPVMDGYEAAKKIRENEAPDHHVRIVAMTGNVMEGDRERCIEAGMNDYVPKPIRMSSLKESLNKWLSQSS